MNALESQAEAIRSLEEFSNGLRSLRLHMGTQEEIICTILNLQDFQAIKNFLIPTP